jgi:hypothetical protein
MANTSTEATHYDRKGRLIDVETWAGLFQDKKYQALGQSKTPKGRYLVSTVWLGIDHSWGLNGGKPLIFETMVFQLHKKRTEQIRETTMRILAKLLHKFYYPTSISRKEVACLRASSEKEALEDHKQLLKEWTAKE